MKAPIHAALCCAFLSVPLVSAVAHARPAPHHSSSGDKPVLVEPSAPAPHHGAAEHHAVDHHGAEHHPAEHHRAEHHPAEHQPAEHAPAEAKGSAHHEGKGGSLKRDPGASGHHATADKSAGKGKIKKNQGRSIGAPNHGRLEAGIALRGSKTVHLAPSSHSYGVAPLVGAIARAAEAVARKHKGSVLYVGDLSAKNGGPLPVHKSHQSGRDADLGMYGADAKGRGMPLRRFVAFDGAGRARDGSPVQFDDVRNWALVETLLKDPEVKVRYLFVTNELRARLLNYASSKKTVRPELIARAASVMMSPENADPHDDHFHLRISCPESSREGCVEESLPRDTGRSAEDTGAAAGANDEGPLHEAAPGSDGASPTTEPQDGHPAAEHPDAAAQPPPADLHPAEAPGPAKPSTAASGAPAAAPAPAEKPLGASK